MANQQITHKQQVTLRVHVCDVGSSSVRVCAVQCSKADTFDAIRSRVFDDSNVSPPDASSYVFQCFHSAHVLLPTDTVYHFMQLFYTFRDAPYDAAKLDVYCLHPSEYVAQCHLSPKQSLSRVAPIALKSYLFQKSHNIIAPWHKRYWMIQDRKMAAFDTAEHQLKGHATVDVLPLNNSCVQRIESNEKAHAFAFELKIKSGPNAKSYTFYTDQEYLAEQWVSIIHKMEIRRVKLICVEVIEELDLRNCLTSQGLFRISGSKTEVEALHSAYANEERVNLAPYSEHALTGLLKMNLRGMNNPLLTFDLYSEFVKILPATSEVDERVERLKIVLAKLPVANYALVEYLFTFLHRVSLLSPSNLMTCTNLAIVIAPNILKPKVENVASVMTESKATQDIVELMIAHAQRLFPAPPFTGEDNALKNRRKSQLTLSAEGDKSYFTKPASAPLPLPSVESSSIPDSSSSSCGSPPQIPSSNVNSQPSPASVWSETKALLHSNLSDWAALLQSTGLQFTASLDTLQSRIDGAHSQEQTESFCESVQQTIKQIDTQFSFFHHQCCNLLNQLDAHSHALASAPASSAPQHHVEHQPATINHSHPSSPTAAETTSSVSSSASHPPPSASLFSPSSRKPPPLPNVALNSPPPTPANSSVSIKAPPPLPSSIGSTPTNTQTFNYAGVNAESAPESSSTTTSASVRPHPLSPSYVPLASLQAALKSKSSPVETVERVSEPSSSSGELVTSSTHNDAEHQQQSTPEIHHQQPATSHTQAEDPDEIESIEVEETHVFETPQASPQPSPAHSAPQRSPLPPPLPSVVSAQVFDFPPSDVASSDQNHEEHEEELNYERNVLADQLGEDEEFEHDPFQQSSQPEESVPIDNQQQQDSNQPNHTEQHTASSSVDQDTPHVFPPPPPPPVYSLARALYSFDGSSSSTSLSIHEGDVLEILSPKATSAGWLKGRRQDGQVGYVPENYIEKIQ